MAITTTPMDVALDVQKLFRDLMFGAETIEKGVAQLIPAQRNKTTLHRFYSGVQNITTRVATPTTAADALTKDEKVITLAEIMYYDEWDPKEFNVEPSFLRTIGPTVDAQSAAVLLAAIRDSVVTAFNYDLEYLLWNGDTTSGDAWSEAIDGFVKLIDADTSVVSVPQAGAITSSNVIAVLEAVKAAIPSEVKALGSPAMVMNYDVFEAYDAALRALDFKGVDVTNAAPARFAGIQLIPISHIPANRVFAFNAGGGDMSELKVAAWADADKFTVKIDRLAANSDEFFIKINAEVGVNHVYGKQIVEYSPA